ncbi:flagellin N-terminal helical domain-containing protein [Salibacterium qingdaonense]|uniref:Flagellin n=1 Tax=Salibacterium qingdaonense TaxID=266892 RepID=A0A1I4L0D9_9BACI|nr:flagellin [Salibacterium qingdaonense]SFL84289.1 flagellin [Salibacterium qingdaonense]
MIINSNIPALNTYNQMSQNNNDMQDSMEKLSSGQRINKAGDDAAGLAISEKMRGQIRGLDQASRNSQDGISMIQTAEGSLSETQSMLQRTRELAVQSANGSNTDADRAELQKEVDQLTEEITQTSENTEFNTKKLLNGEFEEQFQTGANEGQNISLSIKDMGSEALGVGHNLDGGTVASGVGGDITEGQYNVVALNEATEVGDTSSGSNGLSGVEYALENTDGNVVAVSEDGSSFTAQTASGITTDDLGSGDASLEGSAAFSFSGTSENLTHGSVTVESGASGSLEVSATKGIDINTAENAESAITAIDSAIESVSAERSKLGANQNRLDHTISNLDNSSENLQAAESRIRDVDMAKEMMEQTRASTLAQASQSMLAQANQQPQQVLQLLQ